MIKSTRKDSEVRTSYQIRPSPEKMVERISRHPGQEDDKSDLAEQQDAMEAKSDFWIVSGSTETHFLFH